MVSARKSEGALALIERREGALQQYLTRWNRHWQSYGLIGGHRHADESFHDCLRREIMEELGLADGSGFAVGSSPLARLEFTAWSSRSQTDTDYILEVFAAELTGAHALSIVGRGRSFRWVSAAEVAAQCCADGTPLSETMERVLRHLGRLGPGS